MTSEPRRRIGRGMAVALLVTTVGSTLLVLFGGGPGLVWPALAGVSPLALALSVVALCAEWSLDAVRFAVVGRVLGVRASATFWLALAFAYLAAAYGANVGPLACVLLLGKRGVPAGRAFALASCKQMLYLPAVLVPTCLVGASMPITRTAAGGLYGIGLASLAFAVIVGVIAIRPSWGERPLRWMLQRVERSAGKSDQTPSLEGFSGAMRRFFRESPAALALSFVLAVVNHVAAVAAMVALLVGFGASARDGSVWARALLLTTAGQSSPTPGGAGVTEIGGVVLFQDFFSRDALAGFLVLARLLTVQVPIALGAAVVLHALAGPRRTAE